MRILFPTLILSFLVFFTNVFAQEGYEHLSPIAHGAGRTYVVNSQGLSAVGLNPALLQPQGNITWTFNVFPVSGYGIDAGPSFKDASSLSSIFKPENGNISKEKRKQIADLLMNEKMSGRADVEILGVSYHSDNIGTIAFTWTTHAAARTVIENSFLDLLQRFESKITQGPGDTVRDFDFQGLWYHEYSASYACTLLSAAVKDDGMLRSLKVGGALKYVVGTGYIGLDPGNYFGFSPGNNSAAIDVNYTIRSAYTSDFDPKNVPTSFSFGFITNNQAGSGFGIDLGVSADLFKSSDGGSILGVGASVTDIGSITWSKNATVRTADHLHDTIVYINASNPDYTSVLGKKYSGNLQDVSSFTTSLPTMLRLGARLDLDRSGMGIGSFSSKAAIEYATGLTDVVGSLNHSRIGIGLMLEKQSDIASLRLEGGYVFQKDQNGLTLGAGTTLINLIDVDLATAHFDDIFSSSARTDVALAIRLHL